MVKKLDRHLDIRRRPGDDDEALTLAASRRAIGPNALSTRFHDLNLACAHVPNFIDLATTFADDAPDEVVWDVNLLGLQLLRRVTAVRWRSTGSTGSTGSTRPTRPTRPTGRAWRAWCALHVWVGIASRNIR
jgi:hypothetical protein